MAGRTIYEAPRVAAQPGEEVVTSTCGHNCGGRCAVNAHVVDGRMVKISTDPRKWSPEHPPLHACVRGFGMVERVYHPDRLLHPMRRKGPRGAGQWERVSWDEALDEVAGQMRRIRDTYGAAALLDCSRSGSTALLYNRGMVQRFLHLFGGCTELWSNLSAEAEVFSVRHTFGAKADYKSAGREGQDYRNSKLMLMWGWSPGDGHFGTNAMEFVKWAKRHGTRIVCVDPRATRSSLQVADEHIFIRPSTDAAMLIAMAYVMVSEGLHDQAFCDRLVLGLDEEHLPPSAPPGSSYRSYLFGLADGVRKTPEWAEPITGVSADTIRRLAREFATEKPAALHCGYAPGRTRYGEQFHRAAYTLAAITGNIGIPGGNSGCSGGAKRRISGGMPFGPNPTGARVASNLLADVLARGKAGGYPADIKMIFSAFGNLLNQCGNVNKTVAALDGVEFIAVQDHFETPLGRYADVLLPATTFWERNDMQVPWSGAGHYTFFMRQAIEPVRRVSQRPRHPGRPRRTRSGSRATTTRRTWTGCASSAPAPRSMTSRPSARRGWRACRRPRISSPSPGKSATLTSTPSRRRRARSRSTRCPSPPTRTCTGWVRVAVIPTWISPVEPDPRHPLMLCNGKSRARTHSIHDNQEILGRADRRDV